MQPWTAFFKKRPSRFRKGWTHALDKKSKARSRLLRSNKAAEKVRAQEIDLDIKRTFRKNKRRVQRFLGDIVSEGNPRTEQTFLKPAIQLHGDRDLSPEKVDADKYTEFMRTLQPPAERAPPAPVQCFNLPDAFQTTLAVNINCKLKRGKAPGPDKVRTELFKLTPEMFTEAALEL